MKTLLFALVVILTASPLCAADAFDRHTSYWLRQVIDNNQPLQQLSLEDGSKLKSIAPAISSPCIVVKTDEGNYTKALIGWGFVKNPNGMVPVLLIERYVTYRSDRSDVTSAAGKDVMLFAGFSFNFDIGQVVPEGQGGDIRLAKDGTLVSLEGAELYGMDGSQLPPPAAGEKHDPHDHQGVLPRDFTGIWKANVDGRWTGEWELQVEDSGRVSGRYTSDETKSTYDITGRVAALPHNIKLAIQLDNAEQTIDAYLWTKDKSALAGTVTLAGRKFGFYALRVEASE